MISLLPVILCAAAGSVVAIVSGVSLCLSLAFFVVWHYWQWAVDFGFHEPIPNVESPVELRSGHCICVSGYDLEYPFAFLCCGAHGLSPLFLTGKQFSQQFI